MDDPLYKVLGVLGSEAGSELFWEVLLTANFWTRDLETQRESQKVSNC